MKKIGLLCLALVLALGTLGVGYAMWSDEVTIEGTVDTASLTIGFQEVAESFEVTEKPGLDGKPKEVGNFTVELNTQKGTHWDEFSQTYKPIYEKIIATIENGYPCYEVHIVFTVANGGTIPAIITGLVLSSGELNFEWTTPPPNSPAVGYFWKDLNGNCVYDPPSGTDPGEKIISVKVVTNLVGLQLEPCDEWKSELDLHIEQAAEQGHTYEFVANITAEQWAE
jgi:hypothetical protein